MRKLILFSFFLGLLAAALLFDRKAVFISSQVTTSPSSRLIQPITSVAAFAPSTIPVSAHSSLSLQPKTDRAYLGSAELIMTDRTLPDENGNFKKYSLYKTDLKYSRILVQENWQKDLSGNLADSKISESAMAADHLMIELKSGSKTSDLESVLRTYHASLEISREGSQTYFVQFDGTNPQILSSLYRDLISSPAVDRADPDYIASTR